MKIFLFVELVWERSLHDEPVNHVPGPLWLVVGQDVAAAPYHHLKWRKIRLEMFWFNGLFSLWKMPILSRNGIEIPHLTVTYEVFFNPSNAMTIFIQYTRTQIFLKTIETLSCWYSLESSRRVLSYEYPFAQVSIIFSGFLHTYILANLAASSIRVNFCK